MNHTLSKMSDIEQTQNILAKLRHDKRELKQKITRGKERYQRLKGLLRGYKAELIMEELDSPYALIEIEEQIEHMKSLIRTERDMINSDIIIWKTLNDEEHMLRGKL
jgi:hypothetical protein